MFQSTRLREARLLCSGVKYLSPRFQSTRLREARRTLAEWLADNTCFNPRAYVRRDILAAS